MKERIRDLLIKVLPGNKPPHHRVLCFHDINDSQNFEEKLTRVKNDFEIVSLSNLMNGNLSKSSVSITFDDGYESWYSIVIPVLEKLNISATFFVNSGILDKKEAEATKYAKYNLKRKDTNIIPLTSNTLKKIAKHPLCAIGGHTIDHYLFDENTPASIVKRQIYDEKLKIESIISQNIEFFAYPFGQLQNASRNIREWVKKAGYEYAFTIQPGDIRKAKSPYLMPRDSLLLEQSYEVWKKWLEGSYDKTSLLKIKLYDYIGLKYR